MPNTGMPPMRPNAVGLPGRVAMPWNITSPRAQNVDQQVAIAHGAAAREDDDVARRRDRARRPARPPCRRRPRTARRRRHARHDGGERGAIHVVDLPRAQRDPGGTTSLPVDTIATRGRARRRAPAGPTRHDAPSRAGSSRSPRRATVAPAAMSAPARPTCCPASPARARAPRRSASRRVLHHHHRVRASGQRGAGGDLRALALRDARASTSPVNTRPTTFSARAESRAAPPVSAARTA